MPPPALRVEADEPGRRLILAGEPSPFPKRAISIAGAVMVALVSLPLLVKLVALPRNGASQDLLFALVPSALVPLTLLVVLMSALSTEAARDDPQAAFASAFRSCRSSRRRSACRATSATTPPRRAP